jgi:hypothetical protein
MIRTHDANSILQTSTFHNLSIHPSRTLPLGQYYGAWGDLPLNVTGYCSDDADVEAVGGKVSKESL